MLDYTKAKKKFDKIFKLSDKDGKNTVAINTRQNLVLNPARTIAMVSKDIKEYVEDNEREHVKSKLPDIRGEGKTLAIYNTDYLIQCLDLLKKKGREHVAVKMFMSTDYPIEIIGIESYGYDDFTPYERILIAPRVNEGDAYNNWLKNEIKKKRRKPTKKVIVKDGETNV